MSSTFKTRPVGTMFIYYGMIFEVVEGDTCKGCYFWRKKLCDNHVYNAGYCTEFYRNDNKNVIFKRIDK